jgi:membrane protein DedA with SNARE-associated domain
VNDLNAFAVVWWSIVIALDLCALVGAVCYYFTGRSQTKRAIKELESKKKLETYDVFEQLSEEAKRYL